MKRLLSILICSSIIFGSSVCAQTIETLQKKQHDCQEIKQQWDQTAQGVFSHLKNIATALVKKRITRSNNGIKTIIEAESINDLKNASQTLSDVINDISRMLTWKWIKDSDFAGIDELKDLNIETKEALKDFLKQQTDALEVSKQSYQELVTKTIQIIEEDIIAHVKKKRKFRKQKEQLQSHTNIAQLDQTHTIIQEVIETFKKTDESKQQEMTILPFEEFKEKADQMLDEPSGMTFPEAINQTLRQIITHGKDSIDFNKKLEYLIQKGFEGNPHVLLKGLLTIGLTEEMLNEFMKHIKTPGELRNTLFSLFGPFVLEANVEILQPLFNHVAQLHALNKQISSIILDEIARRLVQNLVDEMPVQNHSEEFKKHFEALIDVTLSLDVENDIRTHLLEKLFFRAIEHFFIISQEAYNIENGRVHIWIKETIDALLEQAKNFNAFSLDKVEMILSLYDIQRDAIKTVHWLKASNNQEITPLKLRQKFTCFHQDESWKMDIYLQIQQQNSEEDEEKTVIEKTEQGCFIYPTSLQTLVIRNVSTMAQEIEEKFKTIRLEGQNIKNWKALEPTIKKIIPDFKIEVEMYLDKKQDIENFTQWYKLYDGLYDKDMLKNGLIPDGKDLVRSIRDYAKQIKAEHFRKNPHLIQDVQGAVNRINTQLTLINTGGDINLAIALIKSDLEGIQRIIANTLYS